MVTKNSLLTRLNKLESTAPNIAPILIAVGPILAPRIDELKAYAEAYILKRKVVFVECGFDRDPNEEPGNEFEKTISRIQSSFTAT